jgi:hypothetical protein
MKSHQIAYVRFLHLCILNSYSDACSVPKASKFVNVVTLISMITTISIFAKGNVYFGSHDYRISVGAPPSLPLHSGG